MDTATTRKLGYHLDQEPKEYVRRLLRDSPVGEQPLARLERLGPAALSIHELLDLLLDAKRDPLLPLQLMSTWRSLTELSNANPVELLRLEGMTRVRSARIRAALELGKRSMCESAVDEVLIRAPKDIADLLGPDMSGLPQEQMRVILLNTKNRVLRTSVVYQGSLHTTVIRIADIFRDAVRHNSAGIIVAHNHPSGDPAPSSQDVSVTRDLVQAGKTLDVQVMDHIVIGSARRFVSMKEMALGF